jgi:hypothetical protein
VLADDHQKRNEKMETDRFDMSAVAGIADTLCLF